MLTLEKFEQGRGGHHKVQPAEAVSIVMANKRCQSSWLTKLIVTEDRVRAYFSKRNQEDKLKANLSNTGGAVNTVAVTVGSATNKRTTSSKPKGDDATKRTKV